MVDGATVGVMVYNTEHCCNSSLELYRELFPTASPMTTVSSMKVQTPCMPEEHQQALAAIVNSQEEIAELVSGAIPAEDKPNEFKTAAARVIMKVMYAARMARPDLLRTIAYFARYPTDWTDDMDKRLH